MSVNLSFIGGAGWQFFDDSGDPLSGGKIYTYAAGTTTPQTTYTSRTGLTPNSNPIILDAAGRTPQEIWSTEGLLYKYVVATATNVVIRTWDNIGGSVVASDLAQNLASTSDNSLGDALIGFKQSDDSGFLTGAVARTVNTKLAEYISVKDFGAVGDGVADDYAAITAAIDSITYTGPGVYRSGPAIYFPPGTYKCNQSIVLKKAVKLFGNHAGLPYPYLVRLVFPVDTAGIIINDRNSLGLNPQSPAGTSADGTIIEGIQLFGGGGTSVNAHGILARVRCIIRNVFISGFAANGIHMSSVYPGLAASNCNSFVIDTGRIENCGQHGIYIEGIDANIGTVMRYDCSILGLSGFYDNSLLGNTFVGCHTANCGSKATAHYAGNRYAVLNDTTGGSVTPGTDPTVWEFVAVGGVSTYYPEWVPGGTYLIGPSYRTGLSTTRAAFLGCYAEDGQPPPRYGLGTLALGGVLAAITQSSASDGTQARSLFGMFTSDTGFQSYDPANIDLVSTFGNKEGANDTVFKTTHTTYAPSSYRLCYKNNDLVFNYGNGTSVASAIPYWITTPATTRTFGRTNPVPQAFVSNLLWVGNGDSARHINNGTAAPTTGEWAQGDIVFNRLASAGGFVGWVCTAAGTPGTWRTFGVIS